MAAAERQQRPDGPEADARGVGGWISNVFFRFRKAASFLFVEKHLELFNVEFLEYVWWKGRLVIEAYRMEIVYKFSKENEGVHKNERLQGGSGGNEALEFNTSFLA